MNILVVEDDPSFKKILEIRLRNWKSDLTFFFACNISEARALLDNSLTDKQSPEQSKAKLDLAILDHHLPDGLGSDLFEHPSLATAAVLAVSSDKAPEIPAISVKAGAKHFLGKRQVTEPLFIPLLEALITRKQLEVQLMESKLRESAMKTIGVLLATLEHEINNPLGAVLGGAYLVRQTGSLSKEQMDALKMIEASGQRIKHVIKQLREASQLESVSKANEQVFHIPGDKPWSGKKIGTRK